MPRRLLALLAVAVLAAAACGDSDGSTEPDADSQEAPADDGGALAVKAVDFAFEPDELEVEPGSSVTIEVTNGGNVAHTFTVGDADVDVTVDVAGTETAAFDAPDDDATLEFQCRFHPSQMTGTITVGGGGGGGAGGGSDDEGGEDSGGYDY